MEQVNKTKKLLSVFLRRLTNLSANNRLLYLPRLQSEQYLDLHSLSQLNGEKSFNIIEALIAQKRKNICSLTDTRIEAINMISGKLKKLKRQAEFIFEERGTLDLHVAWPFVNGKFSDGTFVRAPLLLFPVSLEIAHGQWVLLPRPDSEIAINKSLLLGYFFFNHTKPDETLLEETLEDFPPEPTAFRTELYKIFQAGNIDINFNPAHYYQDELSSFKSFTRDEFSEAFRIGELKIFPEAVLGIFPQAGSTLVPDYLHLLQENTFDDLENFFAKSESSNRGITNFIPLVKEDKVYSIFPTDSWQENALKAVKLGNSIVVKGPPGTGKSQLICNLVSDSIANGKRVLVVSQKRAALDVVFARLTEKRLDEFVTLVHDYKNDRKPIFEKLSKQINRTDEYKSKNISLDSIQLDRAFFKASKQIDQLTEELEHFRNSLFDDSDCGKSIKELYLQSDSTQPAVSLKQEYAQLKFHDVDLFLRKLKRYASLAHTLESDEHPWKKRKSFSNLTPIHLSHIEAMASEIRDTTFQTVENFTKSYGSRCDWADIGALIEKLPELEELKQTIHTQERFDYFKSLVTFPAQELSALWLSNVQRMINDCFVNNNPESSVSNAQLGVFQKALYRSMKARRSLWGLIRWQLFSKDKVLVTRALVANQLKSDKEGFLQLEKKLDSRLNLEHNLSKLKAAAWVQDVPESLDQKKLNNWFDDQQAAIKATMIYSSLRLLKSFVNPQKEDFYSFCETLRTLTQELGRLENKIREWEKFYTSSQITLLSNIPGWKEALTFSLRNDFDRLCEFDALRESLTFSEKSVIEKIHEQLGVWQEDKFQSCFFNSLNLAWIDHIEQKHPELRMASSGKLKSIEEELQQQIQAKETLTNEIILLRAREKITDNLEFNRLNNRVTYRDLLHQVTKKKKIWPLRKVIAEFEEEVLRLTPCWLASPESVSALFPMRELFDLVIFDEASQCFAERGIPALYRGKQSVVAGDSKQLRPGDFYLARWQEEDFDEPDAEVDSLLELAGRYLMKVQLNGHYRSRRWELIQFSNKHFYNQRLELLPQFDSLANPSPAIEYIKAEGWWENNCNEEEGREVIEQIKKLWNTAPDKQIGVITFNVVQQNLILDLLDDDDFISKKRSPQNLFVKNIENVQGDERDIIIFSIAYAPDKKGKLNAQFGSLNQEGGENRLNVAVTRAREKVIVVASILPHQLNVEETKNRGPKLLKEYLVYAHSVATNNTESAGEEKYEMPQHLQLKGVLANQPIAEITFNFQYPFADAVILKNKKPLGLVLTDDNRYYQSMSCKAEHALLPFLLEQKGWRHLRVYSRNYWMDKKRFFSEIENSI